MANNQLTATSGSGTQGTDQNPQASVASGTPTAQAGSVQPGTATSLLTGGTTGVALQTTPLSTVSLDNTTAQTQTAPRTAQALPARHHINPVLLSLSVVLCLIAIALFWFTTRTAKNTTDYS
jgi:hypothetical protein